MENLNSMRSDSMYMYCSSSFFICRVTRDAQPRVRSDTFHALQIAQGGNICFHSIHFVAITLQVCFPWTFIRKVCKIARICICIVEHTRYIWQCVESHVLYFVRRCMYSPAHWQPNHQRLLMIDNHQYLKKETFSLNLRNWT